MHLEPRTHLLQGEIGVELGVTVANHLLSTLGLEMQFTHGAKAGSISAITDNHHKSLNLLN